MSLHTIDHLLEDVWENLPAAETESLDAELALLIGVSKGVVTPAAERAADRVRAALRTNRDQGRRAANGGRL